MHCGKEHCGLSSSASISVGAEELSERARREGAREAEREGRERERG